IKTNLINASELIKNREIAALSQLQEAYIQLQHLEKYQPELEELAERLKSSIIEIKDISAEIEVLEETTHFDDQRAAEINDRLSLIYALQKKHRVNSNEDLLKLQGDLSEKLNKILFVDE